MGQGFQQILGLISFRDQVGSKVKFGQGLGRGRPDDPDFNTLQYSQIKVEVLHPVKEKTNSIGAGKEYPVKIVYSSDGLIHFGPVSRRDNLNGGKFQTLRSEVGESINQFAGLFTGSGDDNSFSN